jgi:hypothetical protein
MDGFGLFMLVTAVTIGVGVGLATRLIQFVVERVRGRPFSRTMGWLATATWALGFAMAAFAAAGVMSIGLLVLPFAIIACGVAAWRCRAFPEGAIGASLGTGVVLGVIGLMNPAGGGVNGTSWIPLAVTLVVVAMASQAVTGRRHRAP